MFCLTASNHEISVEPMYFSTQKVVGLLLIALMLFINNIAFANTRLDSTSSGYHSTTFKIWEGSELQTLDSQAQAEIYFDLLNRSIASSNYALLGSLDIEPTAGADELLKVQNVTYKLIQSMDILEDNASNLSLDKISSYYRINNKLQDFFLRTYNLELGPYDSEPLYEFIRRWHRTPYVWGGISKTGVDCSGFVSIVIDSLYQRKIPRVAGSIYQICQKIEKENLKEGDMVFFVRGNYIFHVGIYLKDNKFVHASSGLGVIVSDLDEPYWRRYYFAGGRLK
jgi:lipoprotein Spr